MRFSTFNHLRSCCSVLSAFWASIVPCRGLVATGNMGLIGWHVMTRGWRGSFKMPDRLSPAGRSWLMSRVRSKNTKPERVVRKVAHRLGFRFRLHRSDLPGNPDIVFPRLRCAIFVHGCFWHRHQNCRRASVPATRVEYWTQKFNATIARDRRAFESLTRAGWRILVIWECEAMDGAVLERTLIGFLGCDNRPARQAANRDRPSVTRRDVVVEGRNGRCLQNADFAPDDR
jgi:DNA mismatch endonuclease (patch repair protein)